jgi:enamine deaminase RidA (YjgF/YER057c/UK114 family)
MTVEEKLKQLGISLPEPPPAVAAYVPWVRTGNLVFTSGQLPWDHGKMAYAGRLGAELTEQHGYQAARFCAINALAQLKAAVGDLEKVRHIIRIDGYVHAAPGFRGHPQVLNGASDLFNEVFGPCGHHARLAVGISEMPFDAAVQLTVIAEVADD